MLQVSFRGCQGPGLGDEICRLQRGVAGQGPSPGSRITDGGAEWTSSVAATRSSVNSSKRQDAAWGELVVIVASMVSGGSATVRRIVINELLIDLESRFHIDIR